MPKRGEGLAGELGFTRRENPAEYRREWVKRNRERVNAYQRDYHKATIKTDPVKREKKLASGSYARRKAKYGITRETFDALLTKQGSACSICGVAVDLHTAAVDHDHMTGQIRGILCNSCNNGLGRFKDKPELLIAAASYLKRHIDVKGE